MAAIFLYNISCKGTQKLDFLISWDVPSSYPYAFYLLLAILL